MKSLKTRTGNLALVDDRYVLIRILPEVIQSLEDAKENMTASIELAKPNRLPLIVDIQNGQALEADVRHYYSKKRLLDSFRALALIVDASPLGTMMGNLYFRVARPGIPAKLFNDKEKAVQWILGFSDG